MAPRTSRGRTLRPRLAGGASPGFTLIDLIFAMALVGILAAIAIPQTLAGVDRARGLAAVRYLAGRMALARAQAVSRSAHVALRFESGPQGISIAAYQDGNGNGVRTQDIQMQIDPPIEDAVLLSHLFRGVAIGLAPQMPVAAPVQIGGTNILSFTPSSTASSGSIYVLGPDGTQWAVRVLGATARTRVLRYDVRTAAWVHAF